ncbi:hypothetical protein [Actimicrobium sp. CCI2.3]|uniref:hypothetical protein n=1 Tax=Actimicrobium sp. CCI2.3 TaxID=3048616 RepID=UPI002AB46E4A|nr:hypothetical protein [Actimicrobium sp. CCI2.3]MDY7575717.1 hypothetical protein [Actimicrobium sp. CCI2.3]MEB0024145.1 hypothetical protein [Actimicrobium sp. CCI2.3]
MTFNIEAVEGCNYSDGIPRCEIEMNGYLENCYLITKLWSLDDYRKQWKIALSYLYERKVKKCMLITDINKKHISAAIMFWALYAEGDVIYIHEMFIRNPKKKILMDPVQIEKYILDRNYDTDFGCDKDGNKYTLSEWSIEFEDILHLVSEK